MKIQQLALFFLVAVAIGGVAWVFLYPLLSGERNVERRRASVARPEPVAARTGRTAQRSRREQVEETLKDIDAKNQRSKNPPLQAKIQQAGLSWSKKKFVIIAGCFGAFMFLAAFLFSGNLLPAAALGFAGGFGFPPVSYTHLTLPTIYSV